MTNSFSMRIQFFFSGFRLFSITQITKLPTVFLLDYGSVQLESLIDIFHKSSSSSIFRLFKIFISTSTSLFDRERLSTPEQSLWTMRLEESLSTCFALWAVKYPRPCLSSMAIVIQSHVTDSWSKLGVCLVDLFLLFFSWSSCSDWIASANFDSTLCLHAIQRPLCNQNQLTGSICSGPSWFSFDYEILSTSYEFSSFEFFLSVIVTFSLCFVVCVRFIRCSWLSRSSHRPDRVSFVSRQQGMNRIRRRIGD